VIAAPLLSPYIVSLSFSVLGYKYALLRIFSAFVLAGLSGVVIEWFQNEKDMGRLIAFSPSRTEEDRLPRKDIYFKTVLVFRKILPYLMVAGVIGIVIETLKPVNYLVEQEMTNRPLGLLLSIVVAIPIYLCNGAEILLLRPMIHQANLALGTAIAFSLASTSICITSFVMLFNFLGKKLTLILAANLVVVNFFLGLLINQLFQK
jgi:uncharacterized membrane protein YraQ (UPF0718 family)